MKRRYAFFEPVDGSTNLGKLLNQCLNTAKMMRMVSAPMCYRIKKEDMVSPAVMFYESCLIELYFHSVVNRLEEWKDRATEYISEFNCNWMYYATSKRAEYINEYGGEEEDYDDQGNIAPATDEQLQHYSIVSDMVSDDWTDIFTTTTLADLEPLCRAIYIDSTTSIIDLLEQSIGKTLTMCKADENGEMRPMTWAESVESKVREELKGEELSQLLSITLVTIHQLVQEVKELKKEDDNRAFFEGLPARINDIFDLGNDLY